MNTITNTTQASSQSFYSLGNIKKSIEKIYSQRTAFSGGSYKIDAQNVQKVLNSLSKDYSKIENLKPTDISFEDYKKLTHNAVEVMFSDSKEKYADAASLVNYSQLIDDDILNKIYFDAEISSQKNNTKNEYVDVLLAPSSMQFLKEFDPNKTRLVFDENNKLVTLVTEGQPSSKLYKTKDDMFSTFDEFKEYYEKTKQSWSSNFNASEIFKKMDEIKELYTKKVQENNAILNNYTRNTKEKVI